MMKQTIEVIGNAELDSISGGASASFPTTPPIGPLDPVAADVNNIETVAATDAGIVGFSPPVVFL